MSGERKIERRFCERVNQVEALAEIDRLLADPLFLSPERNKNFLRFIATEYFEGRAEAIKAYAIAVDVFGRPANFDPSIDPIVRIEATRLRAALAQYYEAHGGETGIRIDLPRGRYVPVFTRTAPSNPGEPQNDETEPGQTDDPPGREESSRRGFPNSKAGFAVAWLLVGAAVGMYALTAGLDAWKRGVFTHKPLVSIVMNMDGGESDREAAKIRDHLMVAISQFQTVRLASSDGRPLTASIGEWIGPTLASSLRGQRAGNDYQIVLKYEANVSERLVWWQVKDSATGEALLSGVERVPEHTMEYTPKHWILASDLARTLVSTRGAVSNLETLRDLDSPSLGNGCVLRAIAAVGQSDVKSIADARDCLERTLAIAPNDAGAKAELAIVLLAVDSVEAPTELSRRAQKLASEAVMLSPFSDRSKYALMISLFLAGQIQAAIETGYAAMTLNPNNGDIPARLGMYLVTVGQWEEGTALARKSMRMGSDTSYDTLLTRALNAYRLGRFEDAFALSRQLAPSGDYVANAVHAAAAGHLGRPQEALAAVQNLQADHPGFTEAFRRSMIARHFTPELIESLDAGLKKVTARNS